MLHDSVRDAVSASLRVRDSGLQASFRRNAWRQLRAEAAKAETQQRGRITFDYSYSTTRWSAKGQPVSRDQLLQEVWGQSFDGGSNVVDVIISGLRQKLGSQAGRPTTLRGVGYRLHGTVQ